MRVVLLHVTFGPYHVARARALLGVGGLDVTFIELSGSVATHPWRNERDIPLVRLTAGDFSDQNSLSLARRVRTTLDRLDPHAVVSCGYGVGAMRAAARWARRNRRASVLLHETSHDDQPRNWWREQAKRQIVSRLYDAALCGGTRHRAYIESLGIPREMTWTPYDVVDNEYYRAGAQEVTKSSDSWRERLSLPPLPYFLYVGRLAPEKNLLRLVEAFGRYREMTANAWPLVLVGDGPKRQPLMQRIEQLDLQDLVNVHPFAQAEDLVGYYGLAGCFVLPSISEPWGLVANEAAAAGLPLLVSRKCGCTPELLRDGENGFLIDPSDVSDIASSLVRIAATPDGSRATMAARSQSLVRELSLESYAENLSACIMSGLAACRTSRKEKLGERVAQSLLLGGRR